nr:hypothetical protein [Tanacetum cinerariifolium]
MITCHPLICPTATCTVPRTQLLAASRRHVAASYWIAASDVAPTSAPVNAAVHRSTGDRRSTVAVNDGRQWRTTVDCHRTTVDHHRSRLVGGSQRLELGRSRSGLGRVWAGSGPGLGRVRHVACHVCTRVSRVCPRGIHVDATWAHAADTCAHVSAACAHVASTWMLTWILSI